MTALVIDGQVFQSPAADRGMGLYSLELVRALCAFNARTQHWDRVELVLSDRPAPVGEDRLAAAADRLARVTGLAVVRLPLEPNGPSPRPIAEHNREVVTAHVRGNSGTDFLILSLMQSEIAPVFPEGITVNRMVLTYDVIPFMYPDFYLGDHSGRENYLTKLGEHLSADRFVCISRTTANDLAWYLDLDPSRLVSIDGGPIPHRDDEPGGERAVPGIEEPFVLMPTGNDVRKNNALAVQAFARFNAAHDHRYRLVLTSHFQPAQRAELAALSNHLVFTGSIPGPDLHDLYQRSTALLFPPAYEGLGLPILEAMEYGKPIACSDIAVFREIAGDGLALFDHRDVDDMARALDEVVSGRHPVDLELYRTVLERYSWDGAVQKLVGAVDTPVPARAAHRPATLVVTPDPARSEVGKYVQAQHAELSRHLDLHYVQALGTGPEARLSVLPFLPGFTELADLHPESFRRRCYHLADDPDCALVLLTALAYPGVVHLYADSLTAVWQAMVDQRLVAPGRLSAERAIPGNTDLLASLRRRSRAVVRMTGEPVACSTLPYPELLVPGREPFEVSYRADFDGQSLDADGPGTAVLSRATPDRYRVELLGRATRFDPRSIQGLVANTEAVKARVPLVGGWATCSQSDLARRTADLLDR